MCYNTWRSTFERNACRPRVSASHATTQMHARTCAYALHACQRSSGAHLVSERGGVLCGPRNAKVVGEPRDVDFGDAALRQVLVQVEVEAALEAGANAKLSVVLEDRICGKHRWRKVSPKLLTRSSHTLNEEQGRKPRALRQVVGEYRLCRIDGNYFSHTGTKKARIEDHICSHASNTLVASRLLTAKDRTGVQCGVWCRRRSLTSVDEGGLPLSQNHVVLARNELRREAAVAKLKRAPARAEGEAQAGAKAHASAISCAGTKLRAGANSHIVTAGLHGKGVHLETLGHWSAEGIQPRRKKVVCNAVRLTSTYSLLRLKSKCDQPVLLDASMSDAKF
eukprot:6193367-Pleurochrysis_carterae.AAC.2